MDAGVPQASGRQWYIEHPETCRSRPPWRDLDPRRRDQPSGRSITRPQNWATGTSPREVAVRARDRRTPGRLDRRLLVHRHHGGHLPPQTSGRTVAGTRKHASRRLCPIQGGARGFDPATADRIHAVEDESFRSIRKSASKASRSRLNRDRGPVKKSPLHSAAGTSDRGRVPNPGLRRIEGSARRLPSQALTTQPSARPLHDAERLSLARSRSPKVATAPSREVDEIRRIHGSDSP